MEPGLFGLDNTNRDFTKKRFWGKNLFNSSFPTALACYMATKEIPPIYLTLSIGNEVQQTTISVEQLFGLKALSLDLRFNFEADYVPFAGFISGSLPRVDLVTLSTAQPTNPYLRALEIKLTALPDNQTAQLSEEKYGTEIVVRPDTVVYMALSIATIYANERQFLSQLLNPVCSKIADWTKGLQVKPLLNELIQALRMVLQAKLAEQKPLLMQPIWKTVGNSGVLADNCLDIFVWSDFSLTVLFTDRAFSPNLATENTNINRPARALIWLIKMLYDFAQTGKFNQKLIIDGLTYNTKNDKAFAIGGNLTHKYMSSAVLTKPRVQKRAIKEIILGGGQNFLSPERRLDASIISTPGLFDQ